MTGQVDWGALPLYDQNPPPPRAPTSEQPVLANETDVIGSDLKTESVDRGSDVLTITKEKSSPETETEPEYKAEGFATEAEYKAFNNNIAVQQQYLRHAEMQDLQNQVLENEQTIQNQQDYIERMQKRNLSGSSISSAVGTAAGTAAVTGLRVAGRAASSAAMSGMRAAGRTIANAATGAAVGAFNAMTAEGGSSSDPIDLEAGQQVGEGPPRRQVAFTPQTPAPRRSQRSTAGVKVSDYHYH